jgi:hypothetical protein
MDACGTTLKKAVAPFLKHNTSQKTPPHTHKSLNQTIMSYTVTKIRLDTYYKNKNNPKNKKALLPDR